MNISLTRELESFVQGKVASGLYASASEVVREGLRLLQEKERFKGASLGELRDKLEERPRVVSSMRRVRRKRKLA
jgi:antitoxin ParD1/3/4